MQKFQCCGAANHEAHSLGKKRLTVRHGCPPHPPGPAVFVGEAKKSAQNSGISRIERTPSGNKDKRSHARRQGEGSRIRWLQASSEAASAARIMHDSHAQYYE
jgi:hypothetical protein